MMIKICRKSKTLNEFQALTLRKNILIFPYYLDFGKKSPSGTSLFSVTFKIFLHVNMWDIFGKVIWFWVAAFKIYGHLEIAYSPRILWSRSLNLGSKIKSATGFLLNFHIITLHRYDFTPKCSA